MDDLLSEFLTETSESLSTLDVELVNLEQNPNDRDILSNIFRLVHTIKGTCGFLGLPRLESLAHAAENVLGKFRDGELEVTPAAVTLILTSIDRIKEILAHLEQTEQEPEGTDDDLKSQLNAAAEGRLEGQEAGSESAATVEETDAAPVDGGPVVSDGGFPVAAELLAEVEAATAAGKRAATEEELAAEMAAEMQKEEAARNAAASADQAGGGSQGRGKTAGACRQATGEGRATTSEGRRRRCREEGRGAFCRQPVHPRVGGAAGKPDDAGLRACADAQPASADGARSR